MGPHAPTLLSSLTPLVSPVKSILISLPGRLQHPIISKAVKLTPVGTFLNPYSPRQRPTTVGMISSKTKRRHLLLHPQPQVVVEASTADQDKVDKNNNNRRVLKSKKLNRPVKKTNSGKVLWTHDEDRLLKHLVNKYGTKRWTEIAKKLQGREGKQCRERWHNHLRPHIKKDLWSEEEEMILIAAHKEMGNKWAEMVKILPGRTENTIKNHWNAAKRRQDTRRKSKDGTAAKPSILAKYINSLSSTSASASALMSPLSPQHYKEKTVLEITNPETSTNPHLVQLENPGFNPTEFDYSFYANVFNDQLDPSFGSIFGEGSNIGMENFELPLEMDSLKKDSDFLEMICQGNL